MNITFILPNMTDGFSHRIVWTSMTEGHLMKENAPYINETVSYAWSTQYR